MSVYVDDMEAPCGWMIMCHMVADTTQELCEMADHIGVSQRWIQKPGTAEEHFDISKGARSQAVRLGAQEITMQETVGIIQRKRGKTT